MGKLFLFYAKELSSTGEFFILLLDLCQVLFLKTNLHCSYH